VFVGKGFKYKTQIVLKHVETGRLFTPSVMMVIFLVVMVAPLHVKLNKIIIVLTVLSIHLLFVSTMGL
jgi:hypothetical protein